MDSEDPKVSIVISTRNRGDHMVATLNSALRNNHPSFEVILVDQSTNPDTARAVAVFQTDPRFRYVQSATQGASAGRNIGVAQARGEIVAFTDDDCLIPADWLSVLQETFLEHPNVAVLFCNVEPATYDHSAGFIPGYVRDDEKLVRSMWDKCRARGIGAGMAVRRSVLLGMGGFDESLGPGALFPDCEDGDVAVRALIKGWFVYETNKAAVIHNGFRTWHEGEALTARNWTGIGAAYAKPVACGHLDVLIVVLYEAFVVALFGPMSSIFRLKRPTGFRRFLYFWRGFRHGLGNPVDPRQIRYIQA
jgi:GT2 family glycosyltransferase